MKTKQVKVKLEYVLDVPIDTQITTLPWAGVVMESKKGKFCVSPSVGVGTPSVEYSTLGPIPMSYGLTTVSDDLYNKYFLDSNLVMTINDGEQEYRNGVMCDA